ncbi:DAHL domain-containing protein [Magnetococcus sp. PR-3]|uniref:DAHL domain-containing protein n=1 Tax=Magnetococcus sp. PR-3 TaxID=3120355 RepID=UPI002FCE64AD
MRFSSSGVWLAIMVVAAGVIVMITMLTFTRQIDQSQHRALQSRLQQLYRLDASMDQSLGLIQHGLLNHYDELAQITQQVQKHLEMLNPSLARSGLSQSDEMNALYLTLKKSWQDKIWMVERFKSDQAVLRNSLQFFPQALMEISNQLEKNRLEHTGFKNDEATVLVKSLTQLLRYILIGSRANQEKDVQSLDQENALITNLLKGHESPLSQRIQNLMEHGRLIKKYQARVDRWSIDAVRQPTERQLDHLAESYYVSFEGDLRRADQLRLWMYLLTVVLLGVGALVVRKAMLLRQAHSQQEALVAQRTTELRRELLERRKAEERFRSVAESAGDAILAVDRNGRISFWNRSAASIFGYKFSEVKGRSLEMLIPEHQQDFYHRFLAEDLTYETLVNPHDVQLLEALKSDGSAFPVEASLASWKTGGKRSFTLVIRDITERKAMENELHATLNSLDAKVAERTAELQNRMDELNRTRDQLVSSEKMASIGRLAAGVAHEINTPIGIAVGAASQNRETAERILTMLEQEEVDEALLVKELESVDELANLITGSMDKAAKLIRALRRFTHASSDQGREHFDMVQTLHGVVEPFLPSLEQQGVELRLEMPDKLEVVSRKDLVQEIFTDLLSNSLVHGFSEQQGGVVEIQISYRDGAVHLCYRDDGVGIEKEVQNHIFEPFFTTRHPEGRYGLGLYFIQTLVQGQLQGHIQCHSTPGDGVMFDFYWPCDELA